MKLAFPPSPAPSPSDRRNELHRRAIAVVAAGGLTVTLVGLTDLALLWLPFSFGDAEWEFATIGAHVIGMPLPTVGLTLIAAASVATASKRWITMLSVVAALIVLASCGVGVVYGFAAQVAVSVNPPGVLPLIREAVAKTAVLLTLQTLYFGWLAYHLVRARKST